MQVYLLEMIFLFIDGEKLKEENSDGTKIELLRFILFFGALNLFLK